MPANSTTTTTANKTTGGLKFQPAKAVPPTTRGRQLHPDTIAFMDALKSSRDNKTILTVSCTMDESIKLRQKLRAASKRVGIDQTSSYVPEDGLLYFAEKSVWDDHQKQQKAS